MEQGLKLLIRTALTCSVLSARGVGRPCSRINTAGNFCSRIRAAHSWLRAMILTFICFFLPLTGKLGLFCVMNVTDHLFCCTSKLFFSFFVKSHYQDSCRVTWNLKIDYFKSVYLSWWGMNRHFIDIEHQKIGLIILKENKNPAGGLLKFALPKVKK